MSSIVVNFEKEVEKIKIMHAVNNGPTPPFIESQIRSNFLAYKAARIPYARNHDASFCASYGGEHSVDVGNIFPNFDADENDPASYDFLPTDKYVKDTLEAGTETFFRLGNKIEHGIKKYGTLPPKDFAKWARICEHIIAHYTGDFAGGLSLPITYFEIWNEPDLTPDDSKNKLTWGGTKAQFFDLYEIAAKHLKSKFPNLKIGGPALACDLSWADEFLEEMKRREVPIDFFSWHSYGSETDKIKKMAFQVDALLKKHGYESAESICNEWNFVLDWQQKFLESVKTIPTAKGAAYVSGIMTECQHSPVDMLMYYDARLLTVFNGLFDLRTLEPSKPYYSVVFWSKLFELGTEVESVSDDGDLLAVAAKGKDGKRAVLLDYFDRSGEKKAKCVTLSLEGLGKTPANLFILDETRDAVKKKITAKRKMRVKMKPNTVLFLLVGGETVFAE